MFVGRLLFWCCRCLRFKSCRAHGNAFGVPWEFAQQTPGLLLPQKHAGLHVCEYAVALCASLEVCEYAVERNVGVVTRLLTGEIAVPPAGQVRFLVGFGSRVPIQSYAFLNHEPSSSVSLSRSSGTER